MGLREKLMTQDSRNISRWTKILELELKKLNNLFDESLEVSCWINHWLITKAKGQTPCYENCFHHILGNKQKV